jgi:hypothetical protein
MAGSNFLERFRPLGAPGAAVSSGSPASDVPDPATELAPVFAALAPTIEQCDSIVAEAHRTADSEIADARERAAGAKARARGDIGAEQAKAAARVLEEYSATEAAVLEEAAKDAAETRETGAARVDDLARATVDRLVSDLLGQP